MSSSQRFETFDFSPSISPAASELEIRELGTVEELIRSYRLRYDVYADLGYLQHANGSRLEIDPYDKWAVPFGAFDTVSGAMVGTLRLITRQPQCRFSRLVRKVLEHSADETLAARVLGSRPSSLPSIASESIERALALFNTDSLSISELSRCIVEPDLRGSGISRALMECGIARAARGGPALLVGSFLPAHLPMYAKYGYLRLPHTDVDLLDSVGQVAISGVCRTDQLPEPTKSNVEELLRSIGARQTDFQPRRTSARTVSTV